MSESETDPALDDLGPKPDAEIEPGEPHPGGVDASPDSDGVDTAAAEPDPLSRDLDPSDNPAIEDALPAEVKQGEDTETEATKSDGDSSDGTGPEESPA